MISIPTNIPFSFCSILPYFSSRIGIQKGSEMKTYSLLFQILLSKCNTAYINMAGLNIYNKIQWMKFKNEANFFKTLKFSIWKYVQAKYLKKIC